MENRKYLVAFLDILGFKSSVEDYFSGRNISSIKILENALEEAKQAAVEKNKKILDVLGVDITFKQFSDCVSFSMPIDEQDEKNFIMSLHVFTSIVRGYQLLLLVEGILIRGGISIGGHFETSNMIFSEALIKSYKIENEKAIYPRIVVDEEILLRIKKTLENDDSLLEYFNLFLIQVFVQDWDGEVFLSCFGILNQMKKLDVKQVEKEIDSLYDPRDVSMSGFIRDLRKEKTNHDKKVVEFVFKLISNHLHKKLDLNSSVLIKYKWLNQFLLWNLKPSKSRIKFKYYFT